MASQEGTGCTHPTRRNDGASEDCRQFYRRQGEAARPFTDAASAGFDVASGWKPAALRFTKGPGRDSAAGSVHDSRVPSGTTPVFCRFGDTSQSISQTRQRVPFFIQHISPQQQAVNQKSVQHGHSAQTCNPLTMSIIGVLADQRHE